MSIIYNGTEISDLTYNGVSLDKCIYNGVVVFDKIQPSNNYLCFTANKAGSTVALNKYGEPPWTGEYSTDGNTWNTYTPGTTGDITLSNVGDKVYFRGNITGHFWVNDYLRFSMTGSIAASGNINSMYTAVGFESLKALEYEYCYEFMFANCTSLTTPPELPATTLVRNCYYGMFQGCTSLTTPPELPATTLAARCYYKMFEYCTSLTTGPNILPATTLVSECYNGMFSHCYKLTAAPELPATTLAEYCYDFMFAYCWSLKTVPKLPATRLDYGNYESMFYQCINLQVSDVPTATATHAWRIPTSGTFTGYTDYKQISMFEGCLTGGGSRSSDDLIAAIGTSKTYYTQNEPV